MFRKVAQGFTATHATILALGAMFVPSTLYAVVSYQPVAIVNANTGTKAAVDSQGRLFTVDNLVDLPLAYAYAPANLVKAYGTCSGNTSSTLYTPPSGKSLIIKYANFEFYNGTSGSDNYMYLDADSATVAGIESGDVAASNSVSTNYYTSGAVSLACGSTGSFRVSMTGYLVPTSAVPPAAEAAEHVARVGPQQTKNGRAM